MTRSLFLSPGGTAPRRFLLLFACLLGDGTLAAAGSLSAPVTFVTCVTNEPGSHFRIEDPSGCSPGGGGALSAFASAVSGPFVNLSVQAQAPGFPVNAIGAAATASLEFEYQVVGGTPGDIVPVFMSTSLFTLGTNNVTGVGFASASLGSSTFVGQTVAVCTLGSGCGSSSTSFQGTLSTHVRSGSTGNLVDLFVQAAAGSSLNPESASATADPFLFIDPSFPNASLYSVVLSDGVGNGIAPVPEPGNWSSVSLALLLCSATRLKSSKNGQFLGRCLLSLAAVAGAAAIPARAAPLSPSTSLVGCTVNPTSVQNPTFCSLTGVSSASASATLPFVSLTASAFSPAGAGTHSAHATGGMTYFFQVVGGNPGDIVPLLIGMTLTTTSTEAQSPKSYAQANFVRFTSVEGHTVAGPQVCTYVAICGSFVTSFSGTRSIQAASGSVGDFVNLTVEAVAAGGNGTVDESASAFADPYIYVDPAFPDAALYSVIVSPGVDNSPLGPTSVPEPASAVLFVLGVVLCCRKRAENQPVGRS